MLFTPVQINPVGTTPLLYGIAETDLRQTTGLPVFTAYCATYRWIENKGHQFHGHRFCPNINNWAEKHPREWWALDCLPEDRPAKRTMLESLAETGGPLPAHQALLWKLAGLLEGTVKLTGAAHGASFDVDLKDLSISVYGKKV